MDKLKRWMKKMTNKFDTAVFNGTEDSFNERQHQMMIKK